MRKTVFALLLLFMVILSGYAQVIHSPQIDRVNDRSIKINKIELTAENTIVYCTHTAPDMYEKGGWVNISGNTYLLDRQRNKRYYILKAEGVPMKPGKHQYDYAGQTLSFRLFFPRIPQYVKRFDMVECEESNNCFNFYGISLGGSTRSESYSDSNQSDRSSRGSNQESGSFRSDFDLVAFYDPDTEEWSDWVEASTTVVFNINDNADVKFYYQSGKQEVYRSVTPIEEVELDDGSVSQVMVVLNEDGIELLLILNEDGGLILSYFNGPRIQFSSK